MDSNGKNQGRTIRFRVSKADEGVTIQEFLNARSSFFRIIPLDELLHSCTFFVDELPEPMDFRLVTGQQLRFFHPPWEEPNVPRDIHIVFEDEALLIVDKPPGLPVTPMGPFFANTLIGILGDSRESISPVNRLDMETSGLVVLCQLPSLRAFFHRQFQERKVKKKYQAVVFGIPDPSLTRIDAPLMRTTQGPIWSKQVVDSNGRPAITRIFVMENWSDYALLDVWPETGRTHQIRAHLAHVGHPIVGDKKYQADPQIYLDWVQTRDMKRLLSRVKLPFHALHAAEISLTTKPDGTMTSFFSTRNPVSSWQQDLMALRATV